MAELRDDYLDYLNTSGLLDEGRFADEQRGARRGPTMVYANPGAVGRMPERLPGERLSFAGQGDVSEPLLGPGDLYGPIAAKLGRETADLLVPYLMQSVSRMAPLLTEAQRALRNQRGSVGLPGGEGGVPPRKGPGLTPEQQARLDALKKDRPAERGGKGNEGLAQEMGLTQPPPVPEPASYSESEDIQALTEMVKRLTGGQGKEDIPMRRLPSGQWPKEDPHSNDLFALLERLMADESTPTRGRDLQALLKERYHGGGQVRGDDIVEDAWGWGPEGSPPPWDPDN